MDDDIVFQEDVDGDAQAGSAHEFNRAQASTSSDQHNDNVFGHEQHVGDENLEQEGSQEQHQPPHHVDPDQTTSSKSFAAAVAKLYAKVAFIQDRQTRRIHDQLQPMMQRIEAKVSSNRQALETEMAEWIEDDKDITVAINGGKRKRTSMMANGANGDSRAEA